VSTEPTIASTPSRAGASAIDSNRQSHDVLASVQAHLYEALSAAQLGRERDWAVRVVPALRAAQDAIDRHAEDVRSPSGLYSELQLDAPWLSKRLERLDRQLERVREQARDLSEKLVAMEQGMQAEAQAIRADSERLLASLRDLVTQENELVYERWLETPALD